MCRQPEYGAQLGLWYCPLAIVSHFIFYIPHFLFNYVTQEESLLSFPHPKEETFSQKKKKNQKLLKLSVFISLTGRVSNC